MSVMMVCAFCPVLEANEETGQWLKTIDDNIVAHINCIARHGRKHVTDNSKHFEDQERLKNRVSGSSGTEAEKQIQPRLSSRINHEKRETASLQTSIQSNEPSSSVSLSSIDVNASENTSFSEYFQFTVIKLIQNLQEEMQLKQQQEQDDDAIFAKILISYLMKVPEEKKLDTQVRLLKVLSSVLDPKPYRPQQLAAHAWTP
ncbi:uncharacterized protein LOC142141023 [Mixophyes fleayi]|uniref:uncharacterized protein LOC142141023 n=1 Tax=Mixophyes fleayi TaxID=3061075 RepID=UPI003F4DB4CD